MEEKSYILIYNENIELLESELKKNNINNYIILNKKIASIYVKGDFDEAILRNMESVYDWELSIPMSSLIEIDRSIESGTGAREASGVNYIDKNPYINSSGKNIVIVIIDSGIDYLHPDFIKEDGSSKIISIWDQTSNKQSPPEGLKFGSEFKREQINEYINNSDPTLTQDNIGTGTVAAGIVVGGGNLNKSYKGIATDSELLVVKLREYKGIYKENVISYELSDFLAGIRYAIDFYKKTNKDMIINLTIGERSRAVILTNFLDAYDELIQAGIIIVSGAGNEGNTDIHFRGTLRSMKSIEDILIQVGEQKNLDITVSCIGPDKITPYVISPSGELSYNMKYSPEESVYTGRFNIEGTDYKLKYNYPWIKSGTEEFIIRLINVKPGIWTIRLKPQFIINGDYDVFLPNKNLIDKDTRFINSNSFSTTTLFATTENVITIGCYNNKIDSIWIESSRGTINQNPLKPDIVAPGVNIIGPYKNNQYINSTGTGVSSSIVTGIISVLMEYIDSQSVLGRNLLYTEALKVYLMLGAERQGIYEYPNVNTGYGILNFEKTMEEIAKKLR